MHKQLIIDTCLKHELNRDEVAYVLGTVHWETNGTFLPVREAYWVKNAESWRKRNLRYYPYYGRGFVQLTWDFNYRKAGDHFHVDLINNPDKAMEPNLSAEICVVGMKEGWFTGKAMDDYIDGIDESDKEDFLEFWAARRVVNGTDKANDIAVLAEKYEKELRQANYGLQSTEKPVESGKDSAGASALAIVLKAILGVFMSIFGKK